MKLAHAIRRVEHRPFATCQRQAWKTFKLLVKMNLEGLAKFSYYKSDGTVRMAIGNLEGIKTPLVKVRTGYLLRYYDVSASGIRSFHISNLTVA